MGTLKMLRDSGCIATDAQDAIRILYETDHQSVVLYSSQLSKLGEMCNEIYAEITKRNKEIPNVEDQMLPTHPYIWDDIDGCLAVKCAEIGMDIFANSAECLHIFTEPNYNVLTKPSARKPLCVKAIQTLAMLGSFMKGSE